LNLQNNQQGIIEYDSFRKPFGHDRALADVPD